MTQQPYLHELTTLVAAPTLALSPADGQLRSGAHGVYRADRRLLSRLIVTAGGVEPAAVRAVPDTAGRCRFVGVLRELGDDGADPTVLIERDRTVTADGLIERIAVSSSARATVRTHLRIEAECDDAEMAAVKSGTPPGSPLPSRSVTGGLEWATGDGGTVRLRCDPPPDQPGALEWDIRLDRGERVEITVSIECTSPRDPIVLPSATVVRPADFGLTGGDSRLAAFADRSLADLDGLLLADPLAPSDHFLAAGAPWFLTLFGRDAIWAARMLLPLGTSLAAGTLRALARRQGTTDDADSAQQPGKIMHEIRPEATTHAHGHTPGGLHLPALYYGTVDATPLWISLLHDVWRHGLSDAEVEPLLPNLDAAMAWLTEYSLSDEGFVSYRDVTGRGLANQGWKDSGDAVQFRDGSLADPPISLCEVQGYAFAAARQAAALAEAFGHRDASAWRTWAGELAGRFRAAFWLDDGAGRYPAIALDAKGRPVDIVSSNIAHLLGTGLLTDGEEAAVVARIGRGDLDSGYGLRTLSATADGFNPLAYHAGSVWTHDTAIAIGGLATVDSHDARRATESLVTGLLDAAPAFDYRLPELFGGQRRDEASVPIPYPAACRPQAWSATASIAIVSALLGLRVDVPEATVRLRPLRPCPVGTLEVRGLRYGEASFTVRVDEHGDPVVTGLPRQVRVLID